MKRENMSFIKVDYYRSNEDMEYTRFFLIDDEVLSQINKFIVDGKITLEQDDRLSSFLQRNIQSGISLESLCCHYIEKNCQEVTFSSANSFTTNLN